MINNRLTYRNYTASIEFSADDALLVGRVLDIEGLLMFSGATVDEVMIEFHQAIDSYIAACAAQKVEPEKAFRGTFNVRIGPELHRNAALAARRKGCSLNDFVRTAIEQELYVQKSGVFGASLPAFLHQYDSAAQMIRPFRSLDSEHLEWQLYNRPTSVGFMSLDELPVLGGYATQGRRRG